MFHAKNGSVRIGDTKMEYVCFGRGPGRLVLLPGLGDGLTTVKGMALPFAVLYRAYAQGRRVYVFSRKDRLEAGYTLRQMAQDQAEAMRILGLAQADVVGISQGGMIAQYLAIDHPERVRRLVLAVTAPRRNPTMEQAVNSWIALAQRGDYKRLLIDTAERTYSERWLKRYRLLYPFLGLAGKPKSFDRFLVEARACLGHDAWPELGKISCPTLILGGAQDHIVGAAASSELAARIPGSQLFFYEGLGHGAYEEAKDFPERILRFLDGE